MKFVRLRFLGKILLLCYILRVASKRQQSSVEHSNINQKQLMLEGNGVEKQKDEELGLDYNEKSSAANKFEAFARQQVEPFIYNPYFYNGRSNLLQGDEEDEYEEELTGELPFEATSDILRTPHNAAEDNDDDNNDEDLNEENAISWFEYWLWQHKKLQQFLQQQQQQQQRDLASYFLTQNDELPFPYAKQRQIPKQQNEFAGKSRFLKSQAEDRISYPHDEIDAGLMIGDINGNGIENINDDVYYDSPRDKKKRTADKMNEVSNANKVVYYGKPEAQVGVASQTNKKEYVDSSEAKYEDFVAMSAKPTAQLYKNIENTRKQKKAIDSHLKPKGFMPSISAGAMTNLGDFFRDLSKNMQFAETSMLGANERRLLEGDHPLRVLHDHFSQKSGKGVHHDNTAELLQAIRTYRPSQKIRSLVSMTPHGYHGSQFIDPNYMWVGLGKK